MDDEMSEIKERNEECIVQLRLALLTREDLHSIQDNERNTLAAQLAPCISFDQEEVER